MKLFIKNTILGVVFIFSIYVAPFFIFIFYFNFACIDSVNDENVLEKSKYAYIDRTYLGYKNKNIRLSSIKCFNPEKIAQYIYGIHTGFSWKSACAYVDDGMIITSEGFEINRCARTMRWEYFDEGFPYPLSHYGQLY